MSETAPTPPAMMPLVLLEWRAVSKGLLRGFAHVSIGALEIFDVPMFTKDGQSWAAMPSKPMMGRDGTQMTDRNGKARYSPICQWTNKDSAARFSAAVVDAVEKHEAQGE